MWILHFLGLFAAGIVIDALWALNVQATVTGRAKTAATVSALLVAGSVLSIGDILTHGLSPFCGYVAGAWVGTWFIVRRGGRCPEASGK